MGVGVEIMVLHVFQELFSGFASIAVNQTGINQASYRTSNNNQLCAYLGRRGLNIEVGPQKNRAKAQKYRRKGG